MKKVVIIGCGASGMMAAIAAAREGAEVTVLESGRKPGRKLLLTGNSRCNLTNLDPELFERYGISEDPALKTDDAKTGFVKKVLEQFSVSDTLRLFEECGLLTAAEHGTWIYPVTGRSESVLGVLLRELQRLHVKLKYNTEVTGIDREDHTWKVHTEGWTYSCDTVVLCCGSRAVPSTGSNGSGYELCRGLGMDVTDILPALTAMQCRLPEDCRPFTDKEKDKENAAYPLSCAAGTRTIADVRVYADGELLAEERGQVQFTQNGISGIVIFNMSRYTVRALRMGMDVQVSLDLLPEISREELISTLSRLRKLRPDDTLKELLTGILPPGLITLIASDNDLYRAGYLIKDFRLQALGVRDFDNCQVCAGGVNLEELDPDTMECRREDLKGVHVAGELADIDGPCGGYNLQWAWSSGYVAGRHAALS